VGGNRKKRPIRKDNFFRQLIAAARYNLSEFKPRVPITVLSSKGDQMVHPSCSEALAEHWDLPIITHPSAGHDLGIDDPEWLVKTIGDHLIS
jgi:predicted alpha/beta hydrolase family esterase